jgi:hypothetical protein
MRATVPTDPTARILTLDALRIIEEFSLNEQGISYKDLGYVTADGQLPAFKADEHMIAKMHIDQANRDKRPKRT